MTDKPRYRSIKLTAGIRDEILLNVMQVFDAKNPDIEVTPEATALYDRWMDTYYSSQYKPMVELVKHSPEGAVFVKKTTSIYSISSKGRETVFRVKIHERPTSGDSKGIKIGKREEEWKEVKEFYKVLNKKTERQALRRKTFKQSQNLLAAVNTTKQLLEQWPEVEKYVTPYLSGNSENTLPSVSAAEVNTILGWVR